MTLETSESEKRGWFQRLKAGLSRTSTKISGSISGLFTKKKLDRALLNELEEALIAADLGPATAARLIQALAKDRFDKEITEHEVREIFAAEIAGILKPVAQPLILSARKPHVVLVIGVNGSGKTTTIGKLAQSYKRAGKNVMLAAGDTFRAAAVEQLKIWGERAGVKVVARETGADAAGLAYDAFVAAKAEGADLLLIDTAGRLQNKTDLMAELQKILRVIRKLDPEAPHSTLAGAGRHHRPERPFAGRDLQGDVQRHRPHRHQARRLRQRRRAGGAGGKVQAAGPRRRRRRDRRGSAAVRCRGVREGSDGRVAASRDA